MGERSERTILAGSRHSASEPSEESLSGTRKRRRAGPSGGDRAQDTAPGGLRGTWRGPAGCSGRGASLTVWRVVARVGEKVAEAWESAGRKDTPGPDVRQLFARVAAWRWS